MFLISLFGSNKYIIISYIQVVQEYYNVLNLIYKWPYEW